MTRKQYRRTFQFPPATHHALVALAEREDIATSALLERILRQPEPPDLVERVRAGSSEARIRRARIATDAARAALEAA